MPTSGPWRNASKISGIISREMEPPIGIWNTLIRPSTNARAMASAASVSTLTSLNAFTRLLLPSRPGPGGKDAKSTPGWSPEVPAPLESTYASLPSPVLPGSGSTGRHQDLPAPSQPHGSPVSYVPSVTHSRLHHYRPDHSPQTRPAAGGYDSMDASRPP